MNGHLGMIRAVAGLIDRQGTQHQRLRLRQPVGGLQQLRKVVKANRHLGMLAAVAGLIDLQRPSYQRLRLRQPVGGLQQLRQVV